MADWQIGRLADLQIGILADGQMGRLADWQIGRWAYGQIGRLADWTLADWQTSTRHPPDTHQTPVKLTYSNQSKNLPPSGFLSRVVDVGLFSGVIHKEMSNLNLKTYSLKVEFL